MPPLTKSDGDEFLTFLRQRMERARAAWELAKQSQALRVELSRDMPSADGIFARSQASGNREQSTYAAAIKDYTAWVVNAKWRPELMSEWLLQRRKAMGGSAWSDKAKEQRA